MKKSLILGLFVLTCVQSNAQRDKSLDLLIKHSDSLGLLSVEYNVFGRGWGG